MLEKAVDTPCQHEVRVGVIHTDFSKDAIRRELIENLGSNDGVHLGWGLVDIVLGYDSVWYMSRTKFIPSYKRMQLDRGIDQSLKRRG
jgi:hypothetical protein